MAAYLAHLWLLLSVTVLLFSQVLAQSSTCNSTFQYISDAADAEYVASACANDSETRLYVRANGTLEVKAVTVLEMLEISSADKLLSVSFPALTQIVESLEISTSLSYRPGRKTTLNKVDFPNLASIGEEYGTSKGTISYGLQIDYWKQDRLPFENPVSLSGKLVIRDTAITTVSGLNLVNISAVTFENNVYLQNQELSIPSKHLVWFYVNNNTQTTIKAPALESSGEIALNNTVAIDFPELTTADGIFINNGTFSDLSIPKLKTATTIEVADCSNLENMAAAALENVDKIVIADNERLDTVDFPNLVELGPAPGTTWNNGSVLQLSGFLRNITFPKLLIIRGDVSISVESDRFTCDYLQERIDSGKIAITGKYFCNVARAGPPPPPPGSPTGPNGLGGGAIAGIVIGALFVLGLIGAAIWWFGIRKKHKSAAAHHTQPESKNGGVVSEKEILAKHDTPFLTPNEQDAAGWMGGPKELDPTSMSRHDPHHELDSARLHQLPADDRPELQGPAVTRRYELG